ncbi:MAG: response regulator transcription factor [Solirubrobacterales bacterium]|nr:response regulator transcription factor [Solirubrobacterales bacterium]
MRVLIADDSLLIRDGLASLLREGGIEVVAQTDSVDGLLRKVGAHRPDVAIVDIRMPPTHTDEGLQAAAEIRRRYPEVGILILSQHVEVGVATRLLAESAAGIGYLLKDRVTNFEDFTAALRRVARGGSVLDPKVLSQLLSGGGEDDPLAELTPREREVIALVAEGRSNKGIGQRLFITERAVQKHVTSIFMKLDLPQSDDDHRRILAVLAYVRS